MTSIVLAEQYTKLLKHDSSIFSSISLTAYLMTCVMGTLKIVTLFENLSRTGEEVVLSELDHLQQKHHNLV